MENIKILNCELFNYNLNVVSCCHVYGNMSIAFNNVDLVFAYCLKSAL